MARTLSAARLVAGSQHFAFSQSLLRQRWLELAMGCTSKATPSWVLSWLLKAAVVTFLFPSVFSGSF